MSGPKSAGYYISNGQYMEACKVKLEELKQELEQRRRAEENRRQQMLGEQLESLMSNENAYLQEIERRSQAQRQQNAEQLAQKLEKADTKFNDYLSSKDVSGDVIMAADVLHASSELRADDRYSMVKELRGQISKELIDFIEKTSSILTTEMNGLLEQLNQSYTIDEVTLASTKIRSEMVKEYQKIESEKSKARVLLAKISSLESTIVHEQLKAVIDGEMRLSDELLSDAQEIDKESKIDDKMASTILQAELEDLGYEVGAIQETLFVDGGKVHFRNEDWDENYFMEMSVKPSNQQMDFHMVYAGNELRTRDQDSSMEHTWCSEFGKLQQSLEENGLSVLVKRHLAPGEIPVHTISAESVDSSLRQKKESGLRRKKEKKKEGEK